MKNFKIKTALASVCLILAASQSSAQGSMVDQSWEGHKGPDYCFAISFPAQERSEQAYVTVTNQFKKGIRDEFAVVSGFPSGLALKGVVRIDDKEPIDLLVNEGVGFLRQGRTEQEAIKAMKKGRGMEVIWQKADGSKVKDRFSLFGFTKAREFANSCR